MSEAPITPESPVLRDESALFRDLDDLYEAGPPPVQARLGGAMTVAWIADELLGNMHGSMHLTSQHLLNHGVLDFDGPGLLAAFADAIGPFDHEFSRYCHWVSQRAIRHRVREENENFVSITNAVGRILHDSARDACAALLSRWPEGRELTPQDPAPSASEAHAVLDLARCETPAAVVDLACTVLWRRGVPDEEIERCQDALSGAGSDLLQALGDWAVLPKDGPDLDAVRARLFPPDPLDVYLGFEAPRGLIRLPPDGFEEAVAALGPHGYLPCCGEHTALRGAVRSDPVGLLFRAADCTADDADLVSKLIELDFTLLCFGDADWLPE
ncbi:MAG: hypothetical protein AAFU77_03605 [Myxococcota bacterium]